MEPPMSPPESSRLDDIESRIRSLLVSPTSTNDQPATPQASSVPRPSTKVPSYQYMGFAHIEVGKEILSPPAPPPPRARVNSNGHCMGESHAPMRGESEPLNYPKQRAYPCGRYMGYSNISVRDDGHALVGDDVPPPKFVHTPRSTPRSVQEPVFMKSRVPEVLTHAGVYPLGTEPSGGPNSQGADAGAESEQACVIKPVEPGFPAGAPPREPVPKWGQWMQRSSGYESANSPLAGHDTYDNTRHQQRSSRKKVPLSSGAAGRGGRSQIVFGASAKRRNKSKVKSNALTMNAESSPPPTLAELAKKRTAASMVIGARRLASQIDFSAAPRRTRDSSSNQKSSRYPGGRCLNYESAPGGPIAAMPPPKSQSTNSATFNVSSALSAIVFGGRQDAEKRKNALGRAMVTAGQKHGKKYLNYRSEEKPYRAAAQRQGSSNTFSKPGWLASAGVTELVFSGVQRPVRPQQQQFPHGRSFGSSTLKLV